MKLANLGDGMLFNGALRLTTNSASNTECKVHFRNELQNEDVVTVCELVKTHGGAEFVQPMGILFDRDMNLDGNRVFRGNMSNNLVSKNDSGQYAFFVKDIGSGLNNINAAWSNWRSWEESHNVEPNVAGIVADSATNELTVQWGSSNFIESDGVRFTPIYELDEDGNETTNLMKYSVDIGNGLRRYTVWINGDYVHFEVNGNRYRINLLTNSVDRLVVKDVPVTTIDFSTAYNPTQLRDNLAQNVKTTMTNQIIQ